MGGHQKPNLTGINLSETFGQPCSLASASLGSLLEITGTQNNDGNIWTSAADLGYRVFHHDCAYYHELVDQFSGFEFAPANGGANFQVLNLHQPMVAQIWQGINRLLEPIYQPLRRVLPNTNPLDLAPLVAFVIIISLRDYILPELLLR